MDKKPKSVTALLQALVRIPSVNMFIAGKAGAEDALASYLKSTAKSYGLNARLYPVKGVGHNLLVTKEFKKGAPWIVFAAHMDTVSAEGMDFDPFCGAVKNGRVRGRGSCDDKGCMAAALWALKEILNEKCPNNIALLFNADEEQRRNGATAFIKELPKLGFKPAGIITAEPTGLKPIVAHAGIGHFKVITKGKAAHASAPHKGRSAIKDMMKVIDALEKNYIAKLAAVDPLCGRAQCSINMIKGGRQVNAIPDECVISVDRRVMPRESIDSVVPAVEKVLAKLGKKDKALKVHVKPEFKDYPLSQDLNDKFIKWALAGLKQQGLDAAPKGAAFATDAGAYSHAGIACVVLGPGEDSMCHTAKESIRVSDLEQGVKCFKSLMMKPYNNQYPVNQ